MLQHHIEDDQVDAGRRQRRPHLSRVGGARDLMQMVAKESGQERQNLIVVVKQQNVWRRPHCARRAHGFREQISASAANVSNADTLLWTAVYLAHQTAKGAPQACRVDCSRSDQPSFRTAYAQCSFRLWVNSTSSSIPTRSALCDGECGGFLFAGTVTRPT